MFRQNKKCPDTNVQWAKLAPWLKTSSRLNPSTPFINQSKLRTEQSKSDLLSHDQPFLFLLSRKTNHYLILIWKHTHLYFLHHEKVLYIFHCHIFFAISGKTDIPKMKKACSVFIVRTHFRPVRACLCSWGVDSFWAPLKKIVEPHNPWLDLSELDT